MVREMYVVPSWRIGAQWGPGAMLEGIRLQGLTGDRTIGFEEMFESFDYNLDDQSMLGTC